MGKIHLLNQFLWPDAAPTGIYAEQLADRLRAEGADAVLVGGQGSYRHSVRPAPQTPIVYLPHFCGKRSSLISTLAEYESVARAYERYIRQFVCEGDLVVATSAPPTTLRLHKTIRKQGATSVYWLQDFYPELVRGIWEYPAQLRARLSRWWVNRMSQWDHVVKAAGNLPGEGANFRVIRNWPTLKFPENEAPAPDKIALYTGNLGYCHDLDAFIEECAKLHAQGYRVKIHADGVRARMLPSWMKVAPPFASEEELVAAQMAAEIHLVAAHPHIQRALFPSKIWNCLSSGRRVVGSGFAGKMLEEFQIASSSPYDDHPLQFTSFLLEISSLQTSASPSPIHELQVDPSHPRSAKDRLSPPLAAR